MHIHDSPHSPGVGTFLDRVDARAKAAFVVALLLVNIIWVGFRAPLLLLGIALAMVAVQRFPIRTFVLRLVLPLQMATAVFVANILFSRQGTALASVGPVVLRDAALLRGAEMALTVLGGSGLVLALSVTVPLTQLLAVASWARVPPIFVELAGMIYRYLFLLLEEAQQIREAQKVRLGWSGWRRSTWSSSALMGMVLERAYEHSHAVYEAMTVRGYDGRVALVAGVFAGKRLQRDMAGAALLTGLVALAAAW